MKIAVLVKQVPDTWGERELDPSGRLVRTGVELVLDEIDERAVEVALQAKDESDADVIVISMGSDPSLDVIRKALAMGADSGILVSDPELANSDLTWTARVLAATIRQAGVDLVIAGNESTDGNGGVLAAMIAELLGQPHLTYLDTVRITTSTVSGERGGDAGITTATAALPAVISVTERVAEPRFASFRGIMKAKKKPVSELSLTDLHISKAELDSANHSVVISAERAPTRDAGVKIVDDGTAGNQLADFIASQGLG